MFSRSSILLVLASILLSHASAQNGTLDPAFKKIPFDQWLVDRSQPPFRFTIGLERPTLSFHQRLASQVEIGIDGRNLQNRRSHGELVFFVQITDHAGTVFQSHSTIQLSKLDENIKAADVQYAQPAFFLPGDYTVAIIVLDTGAAEHSAGQGKFRVPTLPHEFLPAAWRNLPSVEFIGAQESPDSWYLPEIEGRVEWAASVQSPARLNVLLNIAASVVRPGSRQTPNGGLSALLPTLKVISQNGSPALSEHTEVLDLARRKSVFQADAARDLNWHRLRASLAEGNTASIDVHSLSDRHRDAQFFVSRVRSLIRESPQPCVLAVLTTAIAFEPGEDLEPVSLEALPPCRVIYVRYHAPAHSYRAVDQQQMGRRGRGGRFGDPVGRGLGERDVTDQLAAVLKPLNLKVFDVETPEQMAVALAELAKALRN